MLRRLLLLFVFLLPFYAQAANPRVIHVVVALCDNDNQGIVKVPAKIGNGQDPANNLYWGAMYGVKTFMSRQPDFKRLKVVNDFDKPVLERLVFRHVPTGTIVVADAYDGAYIRHATNAFFNFAAGRQKTNVTADGKIYAAGGAAQLVVYMGHNGLMDFSLDRIPAAADRQKREIAVFACKSRQYFADPIKNTGAVPLMWTTHYMAPEGYVLHALASGWAEGASREAMRERVAKAYDKYQKCGMKGARALFATP